MLQLPPLVTTVDELCAELVELGKRRRRLVKRVRHTEQPATQDVKFELLESIGADHGLNPKKSYNKASALYKRLIAVVDPCWPELAEVITSKGRGYLKARGAFEDRLLEELELDENELEVACHLASQIAADRISMKIFSDEERELEKRIVKAAKGLPVAEWVEATHGLGLAGLGKIVGETGNLDNYANPGKVWKRLGLAPYKGRACSTWRKAKKGLTAAEWIEAGYSPERRSVMFTISDPVIKNGGPYKEVYEERRKREYAKAREEGLWPASTMKGTVDKWRADYGLKLKRVKEIDDTKHRSAAHIHIRCLRYMEKRIVRDLWKEWRKLRDT